MSLVLIIWISRDLPAKKPANVRIKSDKTKWKENFPSFLGRLAISPYICLTYKYANEITILIMEKKEIYLAPAVRFVDLSLDGSFLQTGVTAGPIQDWNEDGDPINF